MTLRKAASNRIAARVHYFYEGAVLTVCGLSMDKFKVKPDDTAMTCGDCAQAMARMQRDDEVGEWAS